MSNWEHITQRLSALERRVERLEHLNGREQDPAIGQQEKPDDSIFSDAQRTAFYRELTQREQDILRLVCECSNNEQIGNMLYMSKGTVANHLTTIYSKLQNSGIDGITSADRLALIRFFGDYFERNPPDGQSGDS